MMNDLNIKLLENLIKENKISLKEAVNLINDDSEKVIINHLVPLPPYINPYIHLINVEKYKITCGVASGANTTTIINSTN